ncbi:MAG: bifunctional diaminohydroxyphosphoribosylaminopyrimidine deaminase/5-amino-6-(5-phosphoribosylamino)uracil reductase RibD [Acidobacteriaceae bacterium]|nr:bifunctional diaminohydroxyphosphoribosylaminopyrimidine deaminase/5-amino-6-(5-phosphoribosylamino)uracil reductase RibD [Acidobacteriaceae bacterium]
MQQALRLAAATAGLASPNPQVGCVLVRDGEAFAAGSHLYELRDHAEIAAIKQASQRGLATCGATAYVTLEPCSHQGRTGPCADALIAAGITRCVVATADPNPLVSGQGIRRLEAAGVEVTLNVLQQQARDLNESFAHFIRTGIPFVTLKAALSIDGKIAPSPARRFPNQPHWITGPRARHEVQLLRHSSDAVLTGIGTVLADNPSLTDRSNLLGPNGEPRRRRLLRVILDSHLRTPLDSELVRSATRSADGSDVLILTSTSAASARIAELNARSVDVETIPDHAGRLSLPAVLDALGERSILSVLLECGSHLNGAFLRQNLVDKAILYYSQTELGEQAVPFAQGIESLYGFEQTLARVTRTLVEPDARVTGYLHYPWDGAPELLCRL